MSGSHINAKVAYLCNGVYKKAWLKPHREMALLDRVANQKRPGEESPCVTEITVLMACWKTNNFEDLKCSDEIAAFRKCIATAKDSKESTTSGMLSHRQTTSLLRQFPIKRHPV